MSGWGGKSEYQLLSAELAAREGLDFQRRVLPLLRVIWPEAIESPQLRSFDRAGADHLVWSDTLPLSLVVQCKGFQCGEHELGSAQIAQILKSISSFRASGLRARKYVIVHNRDGRCEALRHQAAIELDKLIRSGQVDDAELLDRRSFLQRVFNRMHERILDAVRIGITSATDRLSDIEPAPCIPVEVVPLSSQVLRMDQHQLRSLSSPVEALDDPARLLLSAYNDGPTLLLGEFGFGKTTSIVRVVSDVSVNAIFVHGALITATTNSTKDLLSLAIPFDDVLVHVDTEDQHYVRKVARAAWERLLSDPDTPLLLVIDGLDESMLLSRRGGIQWLFNALRQVRVPIMLTARTEFWLSRIDDFQMSFGILGRGTTKSHGHQRINVVELQPWSDVQIQEMVRRVVEVTDDSEARSKLSDLLTVVQDGGYSKYYGDIPKRPLFLRFLVEAVAKLGVHKVGRAGLMTEWARLKIERDISRPVEVGGMGRLPIVSEYESVRTTVEMAFAYMELAAARMISVEDAAVHLTNSCYLRDLQPESHHLPPIVEPTGLVLNSLLLPINTAGYRSNTSVCFAHRAYQEYFLARYIRRYPESFVTIELPREIEFWLNDLEHEDCELDL